MLRHLRELALSTGGSCTELARGRGDHVQLGRRRVRLLLSLLWLRCLLFLILLLIPKAEILGEGGSGLDDDLLSHSHFFVHTLGSLPRLRLRLWFRLWFLWWLWLRLGLGFRLCLRLNLCHRVRLRQRCR